MELIKSFEIILSAVECCLCSVTSEEGRTSDLEMTALDQLPNLMVTLIRLVEKVPAYGKGFRMR